MVRRLPPGRSHLDREEIVANQRQRILAALAEATAQKGYVATTVEDIVKRAKVSRKTFYELFDSKLDCFMASYDDLKAQVAAQILTAPLDGPPMERFSQFLRGFLASVAADPLTARLNLVEIFAAGPEALQARAALRDELVSMAVVALGAESAESRWACRAMLAIIRTLITEALLSDPAEIVELHAPLMLIMQRLMGPEAMVDADAIEEFARCCK